MKHLIKSVDVGSISEKLGVKPGWSLVTINGKDIIDIIDYEQFTACEHLSVFFENEHGKNVETKIAKDTYDTLGMGFESGLMSPIRSCHNHCIFCFIDQMPKGVRPTLHVKDDDWRLSLIMGNYVTLTNLDDKEFTRLIERKVSPLYISVHSTDGELRKLMMNNKTAGDIMPRLRALKANRIKFNAQIVLVPDYNNGSALQKTLDDLYSLYPAAQSVAVVPVGLTKYREGLAPIRCLTKQEMCDAIDTVENMAAKAKKETSGLFAYVSDEMYIAAGRELPPYEAYEDFPQLENGVGLLRKFEDEFMYALEDRQPVDCPHVFDGACGVSAHEFLGKLFVKLRSYGITINLHKVKNDYFGHTVTVSGLVCACDIKTQLIDVISGEALIIPDDMLRERDDVFLDGSDIASLEATIHQKVLPLCASDGEQFINGLFEYIENERKQ